MTIRQHNIDDPHIQKKKKMTHIIIYVISKFIVSNVSKPKLQAISIYKNKNANCPIQLTPADCRLFIKILEKVEGERG